MGVDDKTSVALVSMLASAGLAAAKFVVGLMTGSLGVLSEAVHSLLDFGATLITYFAVRVSDKPADERHPYGHAKIESVAALIETGLLLVASVFIAVEALRRLLAGASHVETSMIAIGLMAASIAIDWQRSAALRRVAVATKSQALEADALHFTADMWSSAVVLVGLGLAAFGLPAADSLAALFVAAVVAVAGYRLGKRTIDTLIDTAPPGALERVRAIAQGVDGVLAVERARVRQSGPALFADIDIAIRRTLPLDRADAIKRDLAAAIGAEFPLAEVSITVRPITLDDETIAERVHLIAGRQGLPVHHITVQHLGERLSVAFDLEVDGTMPLQGAHGLATRLEDALRHELGSEVEIESHIEPEQSSGLDGNEVAAEERDAMARLLVRIAAEGGQLRQVHNVRVRRTALGLTVTLHTRVDPALSVEAVHDAVEALERALEAERPEVRRIIAHAEPLGVPHAAA